jgi:hypothetical protein
VISRISFITNLIETFPVFVGPVLSLLFEALKKILFYLYLSVFRNPGVPGPTSELSPRAPAQMGRREAEREGGKGSSRREAGVREWIPRPSC